MAGLAQSCSCLSASNSPFDNMFKSSLVNGKEVSGGEVDVEYRHLPKSIFSLVFSKLGYTGLLILMTMGCKKEDYSSGEKVWLRGLVTNRRVCSS